MKKTLTGCCLLFIAAFTYSQQFYFPNKLYSDSAVLAKVMPGLAKQVITNYNEPDKQTYYNNLSRFQIVAEQWDDALKSIYALRALNKNQDSLAAAGINFQYESYVITKGTQTKAPNSFEEIYPEILTYLYDKLPEKAIPEAERYFNSDIKEFAFNWYILSGKLKATEKDSISFEDAKLLCRTWNLYNVYSKILPLGKMVLETLTNNQFIIQDSMLISMHDGAKLSAVIVRKKNITKPQPVVLMYNIYAGPQDIPDAKTAAVNGFAGVIVNTRGKRLSEAEIEPYEHDANDAYEVIDWISKQPWCNGKIGMYGGSYLGFSQWSATKKMHPALKTIVPQVAVGIGIDFPMVNNIFNSYILRWIHYATNNKFTDLNEFNNTGYWDSIYTKWYISGDAFKTLDSIEGRPSKIFHRWLQHPSYDSYWQKMAPYKEEFSKINIPILTITGYFDLDQLGAMHYFKQHYHYNKNPVHYLVIGPYDHGGAQHIPLTSLLNYTIDSVARINITDLIFQWFNYILKDSTKPALLKDKINYQVMGANEWKHASSLSKINNDTLTFYLSNIRSGGYYKLVPKQPANSEFIRQEINYTERLDKPEGYDQVIVDTSLKTKEYLSFISDPLEKPISINGSFTGSIIASINKKDMDLRIQLYQQTPDGKYFNLSYYYVGRASYAKDRSKRQLLQPGKKGAVPVTNTFFTSRQLSKGSRLIVLLGINKNPEWQINYGTGKEVSDETIADGKIPLQVKWFNGSYIKIPVWR